MVTTVRRAVRCVFYASLIVLLLPLSAVAQNPPSGDTISAAMDETPTLWFVELASPPVADGTRLATVQAEKSAFRANAKKAGLVYQERYAFDTLFNGLSVRIDKSQIGALSRISGVKAIWPVATVYADEFATPSEPELYTAIAMTGADITHSELGITGAGVRVGVIDTGIDYDHPDLGGCFGPGCRVAYGYDFVGDAYNSSNPATSPVPDDDPDDCAGHGTHVAGIIGASDSMIGISGVAPGVTFGAYRVFGCTGTTSGDIMIAAMERALADGMQVVNMSIGSAYQWPQYPTAMAGTRLVNKGVVVVASIGNNGANGLYSAGAPGVGEKVIGVASHDNSHLFLNQFTVSPDDLPIGYVTVTASPAVPTSGNFPLVRTGTATSAADACTALTPGSLTGKVALIRRGTCSFYSKAKNAQNAGAAGVVLYNSQVGFVYATVAGSPAITIPVVGISNVEGELLDGRIAGGPVTMTWSGDIGHFTDPMGGLISSFSSYGLSPDLTLKPDLGAPGGNILSTFPVEYGGYAFMSGTSMASPHVAGTAALLLEARPNTPAQAVRGILQNTSQPKPSSVIPFLSELDLVHRQGAGLVQIDKAILSTTKITPAKLSLGETEFGPVTRTLTIENDAAEDVTYDLSNASALASGPSTFTVVVGPAPSVVTFGSPSVTVPAHGSALVNVTIAPDASLPNKSMFGGYIVFTPQGGGQVYRVPYAGFKGDYQSIQVLVPTALGFPWLTVFYSGSYYKLTDPSDWTFTMQGTDVPFFIVHFDHQSRLFRMEVFDALTGKSWFRALEEEYMGRNSTAGSYYAIPWDGTVMIGSKNGTKSGPVPDGVYVVRISVLKALGDASNPAHWETWTSPGITIDWP